MAPSQLLITSLLMGLAAGGFASIMRALPWPKAWTVVKPLSCPLCMGWWATVALFAAGGVMPRLGWLAPLGTSELALQVLGATAVASWLTAQIIPPAIDLPAGPPEE